MTNYEHEHMIWIDGTKLCGECHARGFEKGKAEGETKHYCIDCTEIEAIDRKSVV